MWWDTYWPMPWMLFGPATMIVFFVLCVAVMAFMMRGMMHHPRHGGGAIDILRERYARGEINQAEFEERRRLLER
jgi:putative membrane protein